MVEKIKTGPVQEFVLTDWLREGCEGIRNKIENKLENRDRHFDTSEFRAHMRTARKEQLLALRSLVDSAIECIKGEEASPKSKT